MFDSDTLSILSVLPNSNTGTLFILTDFDQNKVDRLIQYILAVAGQESGWGHELGMIHLIKYVYLADVTYAKYNKGQTYTGLKWTFHHFGPWSLECYRRIEPALESINATRKIIDSDKYEDFTRWCTHDDLLFDKLNDNMNVIISGSVQKFIKKFGNDTYGLLDYVYKTEPMLNAAPGEILDLTAALKNITDNNDLGENITGRQKKKRRQKLLDFKEQLNRKLEERIKSRKDKTIPRPPRYDDIFFQGLDEIEKAASVPPIEEGEYTVNFKDNIWKSKARYDSELS